MKNAARFITSHTKHIADTVKNDVMSPIAHMSPTELISSGERELEALLPANAGGLHSLFAATGLTSIITFILSIIGDIQRRWKLLQKRLT